MSVDVGLLNHGGVHVARSRWRRLMKGAVLAVVLAFVALCLAWRLDGGRWERVETPSMGTVAPVGTLLWVKPVAFDTLRAGDFISFHPPGSTTTYSHRVLARGADGRITTKGVLSSPDPWRLSAADVVGSVRMRWRGVGWLVAAAPVLLVGGFLTAAVAALVRPRWKLPVALLLGSLAASAAITWYQPLVNAQQLAFAPAAAGTGADATYVGTGLLPIRLAAHDGPSVVMRSGQVGSVHVDAVDHQGKLRVTLAPVVPWWFWVALVAACFVPAVASSGSRRRVLPAGRAAVGEHVSRDRAGLGTPVGAH